MQAPLSRATFHQPPKALAKPSGGYNILGLQEKKLFPPVAETSTISAVRPTSGEISREMTGDQWEISSSQGGIIIIWPGIAARSPSFTSPNAITCRSGPRTYD